MPAEPGSLEQSVLTDLARLPAELREGAVAQTALWLARQLDGNLELAPRDAVAFTAQLRHCSVQLREWAPGEVQDDPTDIKRKNRESRMLRLAE
jgi:hypothetical protein